MVDTVSADELVDALREWLLKPWHSTRSLSRPRLAAIGKALSKARPIIASFPEDLRVEDADAETLLRIAKAFNLLDECVGVGATIASKMLAPLRPALIPMWDNDIATAYGFALNAAGYHQYLKSMQAIARTVRGSWRSGSPLEAYLKPNDRRWTAPLAKVLDEWNWIRITEATPWRHGRSARTRTGKKPGSFRHHSGYSCSPPQWK